MSDDKCNCPNCDGSCKVSRDTFDTVKCVQCGSKKRKHRRCLNCEKPLVYIAKPDGTRKMYS